MRWPWQREETAEGETVADVTEAAEARRRAEEALAHAHDRTEEIDKVVAKSRWHRRDNHFARLIIDTFRGGE
jgi:hypothetical protein